jgi:hypothetical protein
MLPSTRANPPLQQAQAQAQPQGGLDPSDPVTQALSAMAQQGQLPPDAPAAQNLPAEAPIQGMMSNLAHNSIKAQDSSIGMKALMALMDVLDAPKHAVQSMMGTDQEDMDRRFEQLAKNLPAPRTSDLVSPFGLQRYMQELIARGETDRRWSPETLKIAGNVATDPTTFLGVGAFKGLAKGASAAGAPKLVQQTLKAAQAGDDMAAQALGILADGIIGLVQKGLAPANAGLAKLFPELPKWTDYAKKTAAMNDALQWLEHRNLDLNTAQNALKQGALSVQDIHAELPRGMQALVDPAHLELALTRMPATQTRSGVAKWATSVTAPTAERAVAYENYKTWLRHDMGIDDPKAARGFYNHFTEWWKQQALASIAYLETNARGGTLGALLAMGPGGAARTAADLFDNAGNILRGKPFNTEAAKKLSEAADVPIPASLHEMADRALNAQVGSATEKRLLGSATNDVIGGATLGAVSAEATDQDALTGALLGGATLGVLPKIATRLRKSSQGIETVLRERGWVEGMSRQLADDLLSLNAEVANILTKPGPKGGKSPVSNKLLDQVVGTIEGAQGQVSADMVRQMLLSRVKVTPQRAEEAARALDDALYQASRGGVAKSNEFNFDYQDLSPLERAITSVAPFATWYLKAVPFFTKQGIQHPVLLNLVQDTNTASAQMREERGLPGRFAGSVPNQSQGWLASLLVGRPLEAFQNPLAALLPFGGIQRDAVSMGFENEDADPVKIIRNYLEAGGLGLNPLITTTARTLGIGYDMNDPSHQNLLRWGAPLAGAQALASGAVERATGVNPGLNINLNSGIGKAEESIRENLVAPMQGQAGRQVQDTVELAIERRVDELALKDTGQPIGPENAASIPYIRARADKKGPIWERAKNEVAQERGAQAVLGFTSQSLRPDAVLTPEEAQIRGARAKPLIEGELARALDQAAEKSPNAPADPAALAKVRAAVDQIAERSGRPTPDIVQKRLAAPTNANLDWVAKEIYKWEAEQEPLTRGYGPGGSMEERRIGNATAKMGVAGRGLDPDVFAQMIQANKVANVVRGKSNSGLQAALAIPGQEREAIQANEPLLQEYFAWRTLNPGKEVRDFLKEKYRK